MINRNKLEEVFGVMVIDLEGCSNLLCPEGFYTKCSTCRLKDFWDKEYVEPMRDATPEERHAVNKYISSISHDTGVDFYKESEVKE